MAVAENFNTLPINLKSGSLEVRLAENSLEIDAAQALRYKVFYEEMMAKSTIKQNKLKRDIDDFDNMADNTIEIINRVVENEINGRYDKENQIWYIQKKPPYHR